jgi:hypothetical protein
VVYNLAFCTNPASSWTRIDTFLIDTSLIEGTFRTRDTFRPASGGTTDVTRDTRTYSLSVDFSTLAVRTARRRTARVLWYRNYDLRAQHEGVSSVSLNTSTDRNMIVDVTFRVLTASSRTRIYTFISDAGFVAWTVSVQDTFWSATSVRISLVFRQTTANTIVALCVGTARRRIARICDYRFWRWRRFRNTVRERISGVTVWTSTNRSMIDDTALSSSSAGSWTRVSALLSDASQVAATF